MRWMAAAAAAGLIRQATVDNYAQRLPCLLLTLTCYPTCFRCLVVNSR